MGNTQNFLNQLRSNLPELATTKDLIKLGIFSCTVDACYCRKIGQSPPFITLSRKRIFYPREELITWLKNRTTFT